MYGPFKRRISIHVYQHNGPDMKRSAHALTMVANALAPNIDYAWLPVDYRHKGSDTEFWGSCQYKDAVLPVWGSLC